MKTFITAVFILALFFFSSPSSADELFELVPDKTSAQELNTFLDQNVQKLYNADEDIREDAYELIKNTLEQKIYEEKNLFLLEILSRYLHSLGFKKSMDIEDLKEEQEEALEFISEIPSESDYPLSTRLESIRILGKALELKPAETYPLRKAAAKALIKALRSDEPLLYQAALISLRPIAISSKSDWEDETESVLDKLGGQCTSSQTEIQRISIIETLAVLKQTDTLTSPIEDLWEKTADCIEDMDSAELKETIHPEIQKLIEAKKGTPFEQFTGDIRKQTLEFGVNRELDLDPMRELLSDFRSTSDIERLEQLKWSIQHQLKTYPELRFATLLQLASFATQKEVTHHKMRVITRTMLGITRETPNAMQFFHTAVNMLGFVDVHRKASLPVIPLVATMELLFSTEAPGLQIPLLNAVKASAQTGLPIWVKRKLTSILYFAANDAQTKATRTYSLTALETLAGQKEHLDIKWLAYQRIKQLSKLSSHRAIKATAAKWK